MIQANANEEMWSVLYTYCMCAVHKYISGDLMVKIDYGPEININYVGINK